MPEQPSNVLQTGNRCFGCGTDNPNGLQLRFAREPREDGLIAVQAVVNLDRAFEGPPGHIHGGILATLFDEAMSKLNPPLGALAMTRNLNVDYLKPSPLFIPLTLRAWHLRRDGRKLFHAAELSNASGVVLARADGLFVTIATVPNAEAIRA